MPVWNQKPVKILVHHTATPNQADVSQGAAFGLVPLDPELPHGPPRLARHRPALHGEPRRVRDGRAATGAWRSCARAVSRSRGRTARARTSSRSGIENEGTYTSVDPPPAQWNRLRDLCAWICNRYGIAPTELYGHRDFKNTACPGDRLYALLPRLRTDVAGVLGQRVSAVVKASWPLLQAGDRGPEVTAAQYLLRDAHATTAAPTGVFDAATDAAVRRFQAATGAEEVNGLLGGESWPVLARTTLRGTGGDADRAVDTLVAVRGAEGVPGPR